MPLAFDFHLSRDWRVFSPLQLFFFRISNDLHKMEIHDATRTQMRKKWEAKIRRKSDEDETKIRWNWAENVMKLRHNWDKIELRHNSDANEKKMSCTWYKNWMINWAQGMNFRISVNWRKTVIIYDVISLIHTRKCVFLVQHNKARNAYAFDCMCQK